MNPKLLSILQLAVAALEIADPALQADQFIKIGTNAIQAYKEISGKPVDEALIQEFERID